jgi:membrane-associated phospholipid phosphatase
MSKEKLFYLWMGGIFTTALFGSLGILSFTSTRLPWRQVLELATTTLIICAPFLAMVFYGIFRQAKLVRESGALLTCSWMVNTWFSLPILAAARLRFPLQDHAFSAADRYLHISVEDVVRWTLAHPAIDSFMWHSYDSVRVLALAALVILLLRKDLDQVRNLILSTALALLLATAISAVLPAVGPWTSYPLPVSGRQALCTSAILKARSSSSLDLSYSKIICFPSFHVCLAVLSATTLGYSCKALRFPGIVWTSLIALSTIALGWHYFVDVPGGVALAYISLTVAKAALQQRTPAFQKERESAGGCVQ